jgi:outer membrane lipoprotein SlyB
MTKLIFAMLATATAFAATGCATNASTSNEPYVEKEYQTGSNIARRKGDVNSNVSTADRDEIDRVRNTLNPTIPRGTAH